MIVCRYFVNMTLFRHLSSLEADPQTDRIAAHVFPDAIPGYKPNAGDVERLVAAYVELETGAERKEIVEAQDVVLIPEIVRIRELQHVADRTVKRRKTDGRAPPGPHIEILRQI